VFKTGIGLAYWKETPIILKRQATCDPEPDCPLSTVKFDSMTDPSPLDRFHFTKTTLPNGLDIVVRRQEQLPLVAINLWYHVGSKNEERTQRGFTHLFEHLMFEGSEHYPGDFFKHLQPLGANINGSTSSDRTNYFVDLPTVHAERALAMESDRMAHLLGALDERKLTIQKGVVTNEYRQNYANRPYGMVWSLIAEALYPPQHPYSWLTIGSMEDIERASMEDVSAFFRRYYVPSNASLAVVGDLDEDHALALAERYFGAIPGGTPALRPWAPTPSLAEDREIVLRDRVELDRIYLTWPTVPHFHDDDAALILLGDVLARGRASRLYRRLVLEEQVAQDVSAYQSGRELAGSFGIIVTLRPSRSMDQARDLVDVELRALAESEVTVEELQRVQNMRVAGFYFALEHIGGFGGVADRLNAYNIFRGDPALIGTDVRRFREVTSPMIRAVVQRHITGQPRVALSVIGRGGAGHAVAPDRTSVPEGRESPGFAAPLPEALHLRSGMPLWVFPRRDLPTVAGSIVIPGGGGLQRPEQGGLAQLTADMLDEGTTTRSAADIAMAVEAMGASISVSCGWDGTYVGFRCLAPDLERTLDLAADILINPTFPDVEWRRVHAQTLAALRAELDSAEARAYRALLKALYGTGHPYRFPLGGTEEIVVGIVADDLKAFHNRYLVPGTASVVVAGDVDPAAVAELLDRHLAGWRGPVVTLPDLPDGELSPQPRILLLDRPGAPQAVVRAGHRGIARLDPTFDPLLVFNQILGGQFTSRLNEKLREERGFTYGVRSQFECRRFAGPFSIGTSLQSDRLAEAIDDIRNEVTAILSDRPPTQEELDNARRSLIEGHPRHLETPSALVSRYGTLLVHGLPADYEASFADRLAGIERDTLIEAARAAILPESLVVVVVADTSRVLESLKTLDWARLELIDD
jgi:zinc protease